MSVFVPAPGFPQYDVFEDGRIRHSKSGKFLKPYPNSKGYLRVSLSSHGKQRSVFVHKLVAEAFLGPRPPGYVVGHKDSNRANAHVKNLEYCTQSRNEKEKNKVRQKKLLAMLD